MENNCSQGSRIQASRAVSCSRHTTRSAQKLSSRDTWQTKQWGDTQRAMPELGEEVSGRAHCPSLAHGSSLPQACVTAHQRS